MTLVSLLRRIARHEDLNFLLTNRIPRRLLTRFIGWFSKVEQPLVRDASIAVWRLFADLDLSDAKQARFRSMHECFVRELKEGARPVDPEREIVVSPCDGIVGAHGRVDAGTLVQAKGLVYTLEELFADQRTIASYRDGVYVTLRLTAGMYHRFHAPHDCRIRRVRYISGDAWNVNPIALARIEKLFCRNERAVLEAVLEPGGQPFALVPVAAILVASIRLHCLDVLFHLEYGGPQTIECDHGYRKGEELGWFEHGSTIIVFGSAAMTLCENVQPGARVRMGEPLLRVAACFAARAPRDRRGAHGRPDADADRIKTPSAPGDG